MLFSPPPADDCSKVRMWWGWLKLRNLRRKYLWTLFRHVMIKPNKYTTMRLHKMWCRTLEREFKEQRLRTWNEAVTDTQESASRRLRGIPRVALSSPRRGRECGNISNRCYKQRYISVPLNVKDIMHMQDKKLFSGARALSHHPLNEILPKPEPQQYNLHWKVCLRPKINTKHFMNTFVNRLIIFLNTTCYNYII